MCFCFDGEDAVAAFRPDRCRERLPDAGAHDEQPVALACQPNPFGQAGAFGRVDAGSPRHIDVAIVSD